MLRAACCLTLIVSMNAGAVVGAQGGTPACAAAAQGFLYGIVVRPLVIRGTVVRLWFDPAGPFGWREWTTVAVNEVLKGAFQRRSINIIGHIGREGQEYLLALPNVGTPFLSRGPEFNDCAVYDVEVDGDRLTGRIDSLLTTSSAPLSSIRAAIAARSR